MATETMTLAGFKVDLQKLDEAIQVVTQQAGIIDARGATISSLLQGVAANWSSPAELMFNDLQQGCSTQITKLTDLLAEMISRMNTAYQNYLAVEQTNFDNLQPGAGTTNRNRDLTPAVPAH